jgi:hypothetical protein
MARFVPFKSVNDCHFERIKRQACRFNSSKVYISNNEQAEWYEGIGDYAEDGDYNCGRQGPVSDIIDFYPANGDYSPEMALRNYAAAYIYVEYLLRKSVCS